MRLTVIDPTLRDQAGHNFDYARLVGADAHAAGFDVRIVTHADIDARGEPLGFAVLPWFSSGLKDPAPLGLAARMRAMLPTGAASALAKVKRQLVPPAADADERALASRASGFSQQLRALLPELGLGAAERLFFPTLSWADAVEAARFAASASAAETLIMLRFDPPAAAWARQQLNAAARQAGDRVHWLSDTRPLAAAYETILGKHVTVAPIPIDLGALAAAAARRSAPPPVRVIFLGESRVEKGAALLPAIVRAVLAQSGDVNFILQTLVNIEGGEPGIAAAFTELERLRGPRVEILNGELGGDVFHDLLGRGHILLAPYDPDAYRLRSSGLIVQAMAAGLAIVAPSANSWIARTLKKEAAAAFGYEGGAEDMARAVLDAAAHVRVTTPAPRVPAAARLKPPWAAKMLG